MTDHEQTALSALVAWRKWDLAAEAAPSGVEYLNRRKVYFEKKGELAALADRLIAERAAAVGR